MELPLFSVLLGDQRSDPRHFDSKEHPFGGEGREMTKMKVEDDSLIVNKTEAAYQLFHGMRVRVLEEERSKVPFFGMLVWWV